MFNLFSISRFATVARCVFVVALFLSFVISVTRADAQGALYVGDISSNIYKVDPTTKQISVFTTINSFPNFNASLAENEGLAFHNGYLYAVELYSSPRGSGHSATSQIIQIDSHGNQTQYATFNAGTTNFGATGIVFDSKGNCYVGVQLTNSGAQGTQVYKIDTKKQVSLYASGFQEVSGLAIDEQDNLYVSNYGPGNPTQNKAFVSKILATDPTHPDNSFSTGYQLGSGILYANNTLYEADSSVNINGVYTVNPLTRVRTLLSHGTYLNRPDGMTLYDKNLYVLNYAGGNETKNYASDIIEIDSQGNQTIFARNTPFSDPGFITYGDFSVPEPGVMPLALGAGFGMIGVCLHNRRRV